MALEADVPLVLPLSRDSADDPGTSGQQGAGQQAAAFWGRGVNSAGGMTGSSSDSDGSDTLSSNSEDDEVSWIQWFCSLKVGFLHRGQEAGPAERDVSPLLCAGQRVLL